jgi:hypothetical protein
MAGLMAPWPTFITCPHCKAKLKYIQFGDAAAVAAVITILLTALGIYLAGWVAPWDNIVLQCLIIVAVVAVGWLPTEIVLGLYLRTKKRLVRRDA